ncbi:MAG: BtrH N-terminal domain-containing protein [Myxococcota bacterium]
MKTLIEEYPNHPGEHCGSVAMRSLLEHYCGLELPEAVVFGLGAGLETAYLPMPGMEPEAMVFGRTTTMESDLAACLGLDYEERLEPDDERAWQDVREEVLAGRPTMLSGDIFYLDYRDYKVHFPGHRFVLLGFDDDRQVVQIADRINAEPEVCSYGALFRSRNPPEGFSMQNLWGKFSSEEVKHDLPTASRKALALCARSMLADGARADAPAASGLGAGASLGLAGLRSFAEDLPRWRERDEGRFYAYYNGSVIEKFGNGGGNFRRLYAAYLDWARELDPAAVPAEAPELTRRSADAWTAIAQLLWEAGKGADTWQRAVDHVAEIEMIERELFERIAEAIPDGV